MHIYQQDICPFVDYHRKAVGSELVLLGDV